MNLLTARGESGGKRREARRRRQIRGPHRVGVRASSRRASLRDAPPEVETRGALLAEAWSIAATAAGAPSPRARVPAVRGDVDGLRRRARAGRGRRGRARGELSAGPAASRRRREGHLVLERTSPSGGGAAPPPLADDDQAAVERVLTRALRRERDPRREGLGSFRVGRRVRRARRDAARCRPRLVFSQRASCVFVRRRARRTVSRDARFGRRASYVPRGAVSGKPSRARVRAARAAAAAHESLGSAMTFANSVPNETDRLLVRYVRVNVRFLKSRSAFREALRFLASARVAFAARTPRSGRWR